MKLLLILLCSSLACFGANYCVDANPPGITCTGSIFVGSSGAQTALDSVSASGGDTVYLKAGTTYSELQFRVHGSATVPNTVTSSAYQFLPCSTCRIGLSHRGLLPIIASTQINVPSLQGNVDSTNTVNTGTGQPPQGWTFIGLQINIAGQTAGVSGNAAFVTGGRYAGQFDIPGPSMLPNAITIDRCLFPQPLGDTVMTANVMWVNGTNITVKNSYIYPPYRPGQEGHSIYCDTCPGPQTVANNTIGVSTIPVFNGGVEPEYNPMDSSVVMHNAVQRYNFIYRPLKYWVTTYDAGGGSYTTANPRPDWYLANGSHSTCHKNLGEYKNIIGGLVELNVFANNWKDDFCQGQWYGITAIFRQTYYHQGDYPLGNVHMANSTNTFTWDGAASNLAAGMTMCAVDIAAHGSDNPIYDCHFLTAVNNGTKSATVSGNWSVVSANPQPYWALATDSSATSQNLTYQNNVYRAVSGGLNVYGRDSIVVNAAEDSTRLSFGRLSNFTLRNNLFDNSTWAPNMTFEPAIAYLPQETQEYEASCTQGPSTLLGGTNITIDHNTFRNGNNITTTTAHMLNFNGTGYCYTMVRGSTFTNNVFPLSSDPINGSVPYYYGPLGARTYSGTNNLAIFDNVVDSALVASNYFPNAPATGCVYSTCSNNKSTASTAPYLPNTDKIPSSASDLHRTAYDGSDMGVNEGLLPQIKNLHVTASATTALLEADLSGPIQDAANTQPVFLEISATTATQNGYTVTCLDSQICDPQAGDVADLNPNYFIGAAHSNRTNALLLRPVIANGHLSWPIGQNSTVTGDDGIPHNLALAPSTTYAVWISAYGDTQYFTFTTAAATSGVSAVPMKFTPPSGVASVRVDYGATAALGSNVTASVSGGIASLTVPVTAGQHIYTQVTYKDGGGAIVWQGPVRITLP